MIIDRYTKIILTIIAISLVVIALRPLFFTGLAGAAETNGCGSDPQHPCYIAGWGPGGTVPVANSRHLPLKVLVSIPAGSPLPVVVANPPIPFGR
jgi:hypothetical protein